MEVWDLLLLDSEGTREKRAQQHHRSGVCADREFDSDQTCGVKHASS